MSSRIFNRVPVVPKYGPGRTIAVQQHENVIPVKVGDPMTWELPGAVRETVDKTVKGEDGKLLAVLHLTEVLDKGTITKALGNDEFEVAVQERDGTMKTVVLSLEEIQATNDPTIYPLNGSTFEDVTINDQTDPVLKAFLAKAVAIGKANLVSLRTPGVTPAQMQASQEKVLVLLTQLTVDTIKYPQVEVPGKPETKPTDPADIKFAELMKKAETYGPIPLGEILTVGRGECRHSDIAEHLAQQVCGLAGRSMFTVANNDLGQFRGLHATDMITLAAGKMFLGDATWSDAGPSNVIGKLTSHAKDATGAFLVGTPLWETIEGGDGITPSKRRDFLPILTDQDDRPYDYKVGGTSQPMVTT